MATSPTSPNRLISPPLNEKAEHLMIGASLVETCNFVYAAAILPISTVNPSVDLTFYSHTEDPYKILVGIDWGSKKLFEQAKEKEKKEKLLAESVLLSKTAFVNASEDDYNRRDDEYKKVKIVNASLILPAKTDDPTENLAWASLKDAISPLCQAMFPNVNLAQSRVVVHYRPSYSEE